MMKLWGLCLAWHDRWLCGENRALSHTIIYYECWPGLMEGARQLGAQIIHPEWGAELGRDLFLCQQTLLLTWSEGKLVHEEHARWFWLGWTVRRNSHAGLHRGKQSFFFPQWNLHFKTKGSQWAAYALCVFQCHFQCTAGSCHISSVQEKP